MYGCRNFLCVKATHKWEVKTQVKPHKSGHNFSSCKGSTHVKSRTQSHIIQTFELHLLNFIIAQFGSFIDSSTFDVRRHADWRKRIQLKKNLIWIRIEFLEEFKLKNLSICTSDEPAREICWVNKLHPWGLDREIVSQLPFGFPPMMVNDELEKILFLFSWHNTERFQRCDFSNFAF